MSVCDTLDTDQIIVVCDSSFDAKGIARSNGQYALSRESTVTGWAKRETDASAIAQAIRRITLLITISSFD
jgi:hypothetical protein